MLYARLRQTRYRHAQVGVDGFVHRNRRNWMSEWKTITVKNKNSVFKINATKDTKINDMLYSEQEDEVDFTISKKAYGNHTSVLLKKWSDDIAKINHITLLVKEGEKIGYSIESDQDGVTTTAYFIELTRVVSVCCTGTDSKKLIPLQKIIFGPPGTGKSFSVDAIANSLGIDGCPDRRIQTVFHPEYTYGDFIAKLMPISINGTVEYRVVAGHFIKALAKALTDDTNVLLQIDEINRGNCAAIFGDIFQLLDRDSEGNSSYSIQLSELALRALAQEIVGKNDNDIYDEEKLKDVISKHTKGVKIPANLSIVATMNTSDESVYFMDSAFKRRWQFQYIDADHDSGSNEEQVNACVVYQDDKKTECTITWNCLRQSINLFMIDNAKTIRGIEDKQIGLWFVKANNGAISEDDITFKLMHYLWDNVFARDKRPLRELLDKNETELATFGQFVKLKDDFVTKVLAKCPCEKPECNQTETAQ